MLSSRKYIFFLLFFLSGFSGLIYQSIWSHYLKLFLGHAAYAQTLVLAIFMGGMAVGSLFSGFFIHRWRNLLLGYAVVEGIIGVLALVFHSTFISVTDLTFSHLISGQGDAPFVVMAIKWGVASLLIFPQSILLGMTFPLMVGGILRLFPEKPGYTLSMLYFTNSLGAVFGVLASSFILVGMFGLPGTMLSAGLINIILALLVWGLSKQTDHLPQSTVGGSPEDAAKRAKPLVSPGMLMFIAMMTGLSSFMYEMGWIRMLVLVLGGSTHSFELMLASFILGLALGGLWIRNRIDTVEDSRVFLGYAQLAMGIAAVLSLWLYHYSFDWMKFILQSIQQNDATYPLFLALSGFIAIIIMLPATFCAGMTLPLITRLIITTDKRENGIGYIYSANTLGAILGIFLSVHIIMPMFGLQILILLGAVTDIGLAFYLLRVSPFGVLSQPKLRVALSTFAVLFFASTSVLTKFDIDRVSSGVFRNGYIGGFGEIQYHEDGKTSTVSVMYVEETGQAILKNNGKSDASITLTDEHVRAPDEDTQMLVGALPLFQKPDAKTAAIIGMGSGMTTHAILGSPTLESVDTIEMEAKVLDGSRLFLPRVERAYDDPRSHLHVEDAKTFFSTHDKSYDIIVSEPPNPWVSGVATLFSQEFYQRVKNHLSEDGLFVQWVQLYEIDIQLVSTVFNALSLEFNDYTVYRGGEGNLIILASAEGTLPPLSDEPLGYEGLEFLLDRSQIESMADLEFNRIGSKAALAPMFANITNGVNSDYFPILDEGAPRARFANSNAVELTGLIESSIPSVRYLEGRKNISSEELADNAFYPAVFERKQMRLLSDLIVSGEELQAESEDGIYNENETFLTDTATLFNHYLDVCDQVSSNGALKMMNNFGSRAVALLSSEEQAPLWDYIGNSDCLTKADANEDFAKWHRLYSSAANHDAVNMALASTDLLHKGGIPEHSRELAEYALSTGLTGDLMQGDFELAKMRWERWGKKFTRKDISLPTLILLTTADIDI